MYCAIHRSPFSSFPPSNQFFISACSVLFTQRGGGGRNLRTDVSFAFLAVFSVWSWAFLGLGWGRSLLLHPSLYIRRLYTHLQGIKEGVRVEEEEAKVRSLAHCMLTLLGNCSHRCVSVCPSDCCSETKKKPLLLHSLPSIDSMQGR